MKRERTTFGARRIAALAVGSLLWVTPLGPAWGVPRPPRVTATVPPPADAPTVHPPARRLVVAGASLSGVGLLSAAVGFSLLAGVHVGNPGAGLQIVGEGDQAVRALRTARAGMAVGFAGLSVALTGAIVAVVGAVQRRRAARRPATSFARR